MLKAAQVRGALWPGLMPRTWEEGLCQEAGYQAWASVEEFSGDLDHCMLGPSLRKGVFGDLGPWCCQGFAGRRRLGYRTDGRHT